VTAARVGPADDDELLAVEALRFDPDASVARGVGLIGPLRGIPYDPCDYVEDIPSNAQPLRATKIAERARRICVEVECWEAV